MSLKYVVFKVYKNSICDREVKRTILFFYYSVTFLKNGSWLFFWNPNIIWWFVFLMFSSLINVALQLVHNRGIPQLQNYNPREDIFFWSVFVSLLKSSCPRLKQHISRKSKENACIKVEGEPQCLSIKMAKMRKTGNTRYLQGFGTTGILIHGWWECKLLQPLWKIMW